MKHHVRDDVKRAPVDLEVTTEASRLRIELDLRQCKA